MFFVNKPVSLVGSLTFNSLLAFFPRKVKGIGADARRSAFVNKTVVFLTTSSQAVRRSKWSTPMTPLRQRMIEDMRLRNYAPRTIRIYTQCIAAFARHFGKSPERLDADHVRAYLLFLIQEKRASWSYYGQAICALRFLYRVTLGKDWIVEGVASPRREQKLPVVLSTGEVTQFFEGITSLKHRAS